MGGPDPRWNPKRTAEATLGGTLTGFLEGWEHHFLWVWEVVHRKTSSL